MKKVYALFTIIALLVCSLTIMSYSTGPAHGGLGGRTNAPGEGFCGDCHGGGNFGFQFAAAVLYQVGTNTQATSIQPGTTYDVVVNIAAGTAPTVRYGFQMTALDSSNNPCGTFAASTDPGVWCTTSGGRSYAEHNAPKATPQFSFQWTAPACPPQGVLFYLAVNYVNFNGNSSGDLPIIGVTPVMPVTGGGGLSGSTVVTNVTCNGGNNGAVNLTPTGGAGYTYLWSNGSTTEDISGLTAGNYTVTISSGGSCTATVSATVTQPACTTPAKPGTIATSGGSTKVCPGDTRTYCVTAVNCMTYNWTPPTGGVIQGGQGTNCVTILYNNSLAASGTLSVTASNNCGTSLARTLTIMKSTTATPTPGVLSGQFGLCGLASATVSVPNVANTTYNWTLDANPPSISGGQGSSTVTLDLINWTGIPINYIHVTATNGCGIPSAERKGALKLTPAASATLTGTTTVCSFSSHSYTASGAANATSYSYTAPIGSVITDGVNSATMVNGYSALVTTALTVTVTFPNMSTFTNQQYVKCKSINACGNGATKSLKIFWGNCKTDGTEISEPTSPLAVSLYPNPAANYVELAVTAPAAATAQLYVTNLLGEKLITETVELASGENTVTINTQDLPQGNYLVAIETNGTRTVKQLVVVK